MKRLAVGSASFLPTERVKWGEIVDRYCQKTRWFEALNDRARPHVYCTFDMASEEYREFIDLLAAHRIKWSERIEHVYDDSELRAFPLLSLGVNRKSLHYGGPDRGTTFDFSTGCQLCGTGVVQTSPLMLPRKSVPKTGQLCRAALGEIMVGPKLADALRDAGTTGLELRQAVTPAEHEPLPWFQIIPQTTMPRMSEKTKGIIRGAPPPPCPVCMRDGHYGTLKEPAEIVYDRRDLRLEALPDVVQTWECFGRSVLNPGRGEQRGFASPNILVKTKVFDVIRDLKERRAGFSPVRVAE